MQLFGSQSLHTAAGDMHRMLQLCASDRVEHLAKDEMKPMISWEQIVTCKEVHDCGACMEQSNVLSRQAAVRMLHQARG